MPEPRIIVERITKTPTTNQYLIDKYLDKPDIIKLFDFWNNLRVINRHITHKKTHRYNDAINAIEWLKLHKFDDLEIKRSMYKYKKLLNDPNTTFFRFNHKEPFKVASLTEFIRGPLKLKHSIAPNFFKILGNDFESWFSMCLNDWDTLIDRYRSVPKDNNPEVTTKLQRIYEYLFGKTNHDNVTTILFVKASQYLVLYWEENKGFFLQPNDLNESINDLFSLVQDYLASMNNVKVHYMASEHFWVTGFDSWLMEHGYIQEYEEELPEYRTVLE